MDFAQFFRGLFDRKASFTAVPYPDFNRNRLTGDHGKLCHAPFRSIRFEQRGVVRTCCFNREVVLGRYPEMTLREIWNSEEANDFRAKMERFDLSHGCQLCEKQLMNGEYDTAKIRQYDGLPDNDAGYPTMLDFSIHNTCNLECVMCHGEFSSSIRKNREKLPAIPLVYDAEFVRQLEEFIPHAKQFVFAGGEPFLIELYYDIWERINELNPTDVHIVTNGTILNKRVKEILANGRYHITHSVDSLDTVNYERIRKNADLDRVLSNMDHFISYCRERGTEYAMNVCPIQQNWEEIPDLISFCNDRQVKLYLLTVVYPPTASLQSLASGELKKVQGHFAQFTFPENTLTEKHNASNFHDLCLRINAYLKNAMERENGQSAIKQEAELMYDISVLFDHVLEKVEEYHLAHQEIAKSDIELVRQRVLKLNTTYQGQMVPVGKLKQLQNMGADVMIGAINGSSEEDFALIIRDHILN